MNSTLSLGPFAFATDRLLAVALLLAFLFLVDRILVAEKGRATAATGMAVLVGVVAARVAYVAIHWDAYAVDPWTVLAFWQGGFIAWVGLFAAAAILAWRMKPVRAMRKALGVLAAVSAIWFAGSTLLQPEARPLPDLPALVRMDGTKLMPENLAGKPFAINVWATWCPPCRRELPMLADVAANSDIPILLANQGESRQAVADYLLASGISPGSVVLDTQMGLMGVSGNGVLPTTIFVNGNGKIVATHVGEISRAALSEQLQQLQGD
tara:strand:+ start:2461 stop:3261 length:801 start_codon:yes stop_codon:yes gene_type:complete